MSKLVSPEIEHGVQLPEDLLAGPEGHSDEPKERIRVAELTGTDPVGPTRRRY